MLASTLDAALHRMGIQRCLSVSANAAGDYEYSRTAAKVDSLEARRNSLASPFSASRMLTLCMMCCVQVEKSCVRAYRQLVLSVGCDAGMVMFSSWCVLVGRIVVCIGQCSVTPKHLYTAGCAMTGSTKQNTVLTKGRQVGMKAASRREKACSRGSRGGKDMWFGRCRDAVGIGGGRLGLPRRDS